MGIETALLIGAGLAGGMAISGMMPKPPKIDIPKPEKPPQASKTPDRSGVVQANAGAALPGGSLAGNSGTFLTGPSGIDPSALNLGKNTLLGQ